MPVQRRVHVVDPTIVRSSNGVDSLVDKLIVIHSESLPLVLTLANGDAALKVARHRLQVLDQLAFLGVDHRHQPFMISLAAAWPTRRQRREWSCIAATQLAP